MMMGRKNYGLKYVNEKIRLDQLTGGGKGVFKHNLKVLKEGAKSLFCLCYGFFFSLFFLSFFFSA